MMVDVSLVRMLVRVMVMFASGMRMGVRVSMSMIGVTERGGSLCQARLTLSFFSVA